jgi:hypothetical protein
VKAKRPFRFTLDELQAIGNAISMATAGELDGDEWTEELTDALDSAETKVHAEYVRRVRLEEAKGKRP